MLKDVGYVLKKLDWMRAERIWPDGERYLWTDAFSVVLYVSLFHSTQDERWLDAAQTLVVDVDSVLGRPRGIRIGEAPDRDGQYFHYLAMWLFALARLGENKPEYRERGVALARDIHRAFCHSRPRGRLEDAGGSQRTVPGLRPRRHGRL